jgi:hypothetical protein
MKKLTRERVVPIISARVSWVMGGINVPGSPGLPNSAISRRMRITLDQEDLDSYQPATDFLNGNGHHIGLSATRSRHFLKDQTAAIFWHSCAG